MLLELLTGKRPMDEAFLEEGTQLVTWVRVEFFLFFGLFFMLFLSPMVKDSLPLKLVRSDIQLLKIRLS